jgi:uncharacterized protein YjcR
MGNKQHLEPEGFKLYRKNTPQNEIAEILGVSQPTITEWKQKFDWVKRKRDWDNSNHASLEKLLVLRDKKIQEGDADGAWKVQKIIDSIDGQFDRLAYTLEIMEDFIKYMRAEHPKKFQTVQGVITEFFTVQRNKYGKV